jgi:hypothetical protein
MTKTLSPLAALVLPMIGRAVLVADKTGTETEYKIAKLSDKLGSLKDGSKGEYVVLQNSADEAVVINVHPASAKRLVTKGEEAGMKLVPAAEADETEAGSTTETTEAAAPEADAAPADAAPKSPSKKELFMTAYKAGVAAGSDRKTIKAAIADLGLSEAGFNTYYQNAKSGKWA